jgi:purine-nucleoside phosphorylase
MKPQNKPLHIICEKDDIADIVLMSGDPLRAKYIAEKFLENPVLVNTLRNMYAYTGTYKGKRITVMGHGMGIPSICIYVFELIYYFNVKKIIRVGTAGVVDPSLKLGDVVLSTDAYSESSFAFQYDGNAKIIENASSSLNEKVLRVAQSNNINIVTGTVLTTDIFGPYAEIELLLKRMPPEVKPKIEEMEAFGLFYMANKYKIDATCLVTIVDSKFVEEIISPEDRERALDNMIILGLDTLVSE